MAVRHNVKIPTDGLMLHLDASNPQSNRGNVGVWYDISGNNRHATMVNGMGPGSIGGAPAMMSSQASESYAVINHDAEISRRVFGAQLVGTLCAWYYLTEAVNWACLINKAFDGNWSNTTLGLWNFTGGAVVVVGTNETGNPDGSNLQLTHPNLFNQWVHLVGVYEGDRVKGYINNQPFGDVHIADHINRPRSENTSPITIGRRLPSQGPSFNGGIGVISVYDRYLSPAEVDAIFQVQRKRYGV